MLDGYLQSVVNIALVIIIQVVIALAGVFVVRLIKKLLKKTGIEIDEAMMSEIEDIILKAVSVTNQLFSSKYKEENPDHKLTEDQQLEVFNHAKDIIMSSLSSEQVEAIVKKYGVDIDEALKLLIENCVYWNHSSVLTLDSTVE